MKQKFTKFGVLVAMLLAFLPASAYDFEVDGFYYEVVSLPALTCKVVAGDNKYEGEVVIPAEVTFNNRTLKVTEIGGSAFKGCSWLTSVTIPDSVTKIGDSAFNQCSSLTSVTIPDSVTSIGFNAFSGCSSLTSVTIPDSVTEIDYSAFSGCSSLTSITIPDSVTEIYYGVFSGCSSLTSITIPNSVTEIGGEAFRGCSSLTSITIPDSVTEIDYSAFSGCSSLTSITIPNSVTEIGRYAFWGCSSLTSITIPDSVTYIGRYAFSRCSALENITLSENLTRIDYGTFQECKSLSSISIPGNVKEIVQYYRPINGRESDYTFDECELLKEVLFMYGESILKSGYEYNYGFWSCKWEPWTEQLEKVFIDRELEYDLPVPNLKELTIGEHLTELQSVDINKCSQLESIVSYAMTPPTVSKRFSNVQYMNLVVKVPNEALEVYQKDSVWGNFWNLQGFNTSGVDDVEIDSVDKTVVGRYDLNGRPVNEDYKGITIVRFSDGSTKKVVL